MRFHRAQHHSANLDARGVGHGRVECIEAVQLAVDPSVELEAVLDIFWEAHDPTGSIHGSDETAAQQASCIFYHSASQREAAVASRGRLQHTMGQQVETRIRPATAFWEAEASQPRLGALQE